MSKRLHGPEELDAAIEAHELGQRFRSAPDGLALACMRGLGRRGSRRLRRGGGAPFTPADVADLEAWHRGDQFAAGGVPDLSGSGHDLAPLSGTVTTTTRAGQTALVFNGSASLRCAFGHSHPHPMTHYIVWEATSTAALQVLSDGDDVSNRHAIYLNSTGPTITAQANTALSGGTPSANQINATCFVANTTSSALYALSNFANASASGNSGSASLDGLTLGASNGDAGKLTGFIWERIIYRGAHDASTRARIARYMMKRYSGLTITV